MTEFVASTWLRANAPQYEIISWGGNSQVKTKFRRIEDGHEFDITFTNLKVHHREGREIGTNKDSEEGARFWLKNNTPHIQLLKWAGKGTEQSLYFDSDRNKEFSLSFRELKSLFKARPNYTPRPTKEELNEKKKNLNLKKYGVVSNLCLKETKQQIKDTNLEKYGVEYPGQSKEIQKRIKKTRIENGTTISINGKTPADIALEKDISITTASTLIRSNIDIESYTNKKTSLEAFTKDHILDQIKNVKYKFNKAIDGRKYDFLIEDKMLVLECNGLYWHSDLYFNGKNKDPKTYHKIKRSHYQSHGYRSLFFGEDEIKKKTNIVKSIVLNAVGGSTKIFARKCEIKELSKDDAKLFFTENHLMGTGKGRTYALLLDSNIMAAIQVKWSGPKEKKELEISRFCTLNNHSVVGGYSRLINHVKNVELPNKIITFVDLRYGSGEYLKNFGFVKMSENVSFKWTDFKNTFHRMKFPGESGYEKGLHKIWDCGQAKFVANCLPSSI